MPSYEVTGTLSPDATGLYTQAGEMNGQPYFAREAGGWFISYIHFFSTVYAWAISSIPGVHTDQRWGKFPPPPYPDGPYPAGMLGTYLPVETTGTATVAELDDSLASAAVGSGITLGLSLDLS